MPSHESLTPFVASPPAGEAEEEKPSFDPKAAAFIREEWIARQMNDRSHEFTELQDIQATMCTF